MLQRTTYTRHPPPHSNPTTELISPIPPRLTHVASPFPIPTDHISLPAFATNAAATKTWTATYQPFGEVRTTTGTPIALRFPGQWFQSESSLHQNWMRDYDPTTGRYIEADPLGLVDVANIYGYVKGNPGRWVDPNGEFGLAGALIGGGSNFGLQFIANYIKYGSALTALKCVDIKDVVISAGIGALGGSLFKVFRAKGIGGALGLVAVSTYTKRIAAPTPIQIGDECECDGGHKLDGRKRKFVDFVDRMSPQL